MPRTLSHDQIRGFRDQLCTAAEGLFAERGFEGVTLRALAAELGCSAMTPYRYFENKQAIFAAVRTAAFVRFGERIVASGKGIEDALERTRAYAYAYLAFAREEPAAYRIMFELTQPTDLDNEMLADPETEEQIVHGWTPLVATLSEAVEGGQLEGDPLTLAHVAWSMLHGLASLELSDKLQLGCDYEMLVEPALACFFRGVGASAIAAPPASSDRPSRPDLGRSTP